MISNEQIDRALSEMSNEASVAIQRARLAELALENYSYPRTPHDSGQYDPAERERLLTEFREADYMAESKSWISNLIRESKIKRGIPDAAVCFFRDGDRWCCVFGDFQNLQESSAGFGETFEDALADLNGNGRALEGRLP